MGNSEAVQFPVPRDARRAADRAGLGIGGRPAATVTAQGIHGALELAHDLDGTVTVGGLAAMVGAAHEGALGDAASAQKVPSARRRALSWPVIPSSARMATVC